MPSEPAESNFKNKVKATAYPTQERSGLIWIYMGPRSEPPPLPSLNANMQPEGKYQIGSYSSECNWFQSLEGDFDTIHVSFLHSGSVQFEDVPLPDEAFNRYAMRTRWARHFVTDTEFGCTSGNNRPAEEDSTYWRVAQYLYPFYAMPPASFSNLGVIAVVPIDDENCLRFHMNCQEGDTERRGGAWPTADGVTTGYHSDPRHNTSDWLGRFKLAGNVRNDYLIDRDVQRANKGGMGYSGVPGRGQDGSVTESMGVIYKRDNEHLGVTDSGIIRMRRLLIKHARALRDEGKIPPAVDNPELYRVTTACALLPNSVVDGIEATKDMQWSVLTQEPSKLIARA